MAIELLSDEVIDQIAAGEVVERPASVLKELLENAMDAGARELTVRLRSGGTALVQVVDDGCGMSPADATMSIERHATSKVRTLDDVMGVRTFGFRGEALAAISSVSRFELRTRRAEDEVGTRVKVDGGMLAGIEAVGAPVGTDISVRQLFHNVPVRRKFLRATQTELSHCLAAIHQQTMLRPDVGITIFSEGRRVLRSAPSDDVARRIRDILGDDAKALATVDAQDRGVKVQGWISPPGFHRSSSAMYLYVNGRFVKDPVVRRAVTEGYRGLLPKGRYPVVVLSIEVDPGSVDVNVHPAKTEVRFARARDVSQVVSTALRDALQESSRIQWEDKPVRVRPERKPTVEAMPQKGLFDQPHADAAATLPGAPGRDPVPVSVRVPDHGEPMTSALPGGSGVDPVPVPVPVPVPENGERQTSAQPTTSFGNPIPAPDTPASPNPRTHTHTRTGHGQDAGFGLGGAGVMGEVQAGPEVHGSAMSGTGTGTDPSTGTGSEAPVAGAPVSGWSALHPLHQLTHVALTTDGQHLLALDLRLLRQSWTRQRWHDARAAGLVPTTPLWMPAVVGLPPRSCAALVAAADSLSELGVEISAFGPGELALMSLPEFLHPDEPEAVLKALSELTDLTADAVIDALVPLQPHGVADAYGLQQLLAMLDEIGLPRDEHPGVRAWTPEELMRG